MTSPPESLYRLSFGGSLFGAETWAMNLHLNSPAPVGTTPDAYSPALETLFLAAPARMSGGSKLEWIKFNEINAATNLYKSPSISQTYFLPAARVGAGNLGPPQCSVCISLRTDAMRGRAHAGRVYPPTAIMYSDFGMDGLITASAALAIRDAWTTALNGINLVSTANVVVWSHVGQVIQPVVGCRVGRVVDTQQRRRKSLAETPTAVSVVTG